MKIDSFDWLHRTGANPPERPNTHRLRVRRHTPRPH